MAQHGDFIFADLSTYELKVAWEFYHKLFGWQYSELDGYLTAQNGTQSVSGLYETPSRFKAMNMPPFWMSYIQVDSVDETVNKADSMGGIIELVEESPIGKIALIRDLLGAGFTIYEGSQLSARTKDQPNTLVWNELQVSDAKKNMPFYETLFGWTFEAEAGDASRYKILNAQGQEISTIQEISNEIKGKHEYWACYFAVPNLEKAKEIILKNEGKIIYEDHSSTLVNDMFGAGFYITETESSSLGKKKNTSVIKRWRALATLGIIIVSLILSWYWMFGVIFLWWSIEGIRNRQAFMTELIFRDETPILYWFVTLLWIGLSILSILEYVK